MPPGGIRRWICLVIFGLITTTEQSVAGGTRSRNDSAQQFPTFPVYLSPEVDSKTVKVGQSFGIQGISDNSRGGGSGATANRSQAVIAASPQRNLVAGSSHYGSQPNSFVPSQFMGFKKPNQEKNVPPTTFPSNAQRRVDFHVADDDSEAYNEDDTYEPERDGYYHGRHEIEVHSNSGIRYEDDHQYLEEPKTREEQPPETRQSLGFPVSGPGFIGPAPFDPLPPPPASIKGSVDYILIPLVLIGIAGPIFVVLYVILGAFEAKISPISRSLDGLDAYKPYLENVMSSVGRALDTEKCLDYAACQFGSLCNRLGYTDTFPTMQKTMEPFMPHPYKRRMRAVFNSMAKNSGNCSINSCIRL